MRHLRRKMRRTLGLHQPKCEVAHFVHLDEPLFGQDRFDDRLAAFADRQGDLIVLDLFEQAKLVEHRHDLFTGGETIQSVKLRSGGRVHRAVVVHDQQLLESVPFADLIVVRVVSRRDLYSTRTKFGLDIFVSDDRYLAVRQRQSYLLSNKVLVTLVTRIYGNRGIAKHRLGPRGRNGQCLVRSDDRIFEVRELAVLPRLFLDLEVREYGLVLGAPINYA